MVGGCTQYAVLMVVVAAVVVEAGEDKTQLRGRGEQEEAKRKCAITTNYKTVCMWEFVRVSFLHVSISL